MHQKNSFIFASNHSINYLINSINLVLLKDKTNKNKAHKKNTVKVHALH